MHFRHEWHPIQWALSFWICIHAENCTVFVTSRPHITEDRTVIIILLKRKSLLCQVAQGSVYFWYNINISWTKITNGGAECGAQNGLAPRSRYFLFTTKFYFLFVDGSKQKELQLGKAGPLNEWVTRLTFWRRNYFFILAHPVYKTWIIQEPNMLELWNKLHFEEKKTESIYHV